MRSSRLLAQLRLASGLTILVGWIATTSHSAAPSGAGQSEALANLVSEIVTCRTHPCLGDSVKSVREAVNDAIVTDDTFYYSDLTVAYPAARGDLQGLVEWEFDDGLDAISMKIIDFHAAPPEVIAEVEQAFPDCHMEGDGAEADAPGEETDDEIPVNEWECDVVDEDTREMEVYLYFAPGLVVLELYL